MDRKNDLGSRMASFSESLVKAIDMVKPLPGEEVPLVEAVDRISISDVYAAASSPNIDVSMRDGYAVHLSDIVDASKENPISLNVVGTETAAGMIKENVNAVLTGGRIPTGGDQVICEEDVAFDREKNIITVTSSEGQDVRKGDLLLPAGSIFGPTDISECCAGGVWNVKVRRRVRAYLLATGSELVQPGDVLLPGQIYPSNVIGLSSWLTRMGVDVVYDSVLDDYGKIKEKIEGTLKENDVVITTGGTWLSSKDFLLDVMKEIGWSNFFERVRLGPGKGISCGVVNNTGTIVSLLPGMPSSCLVSFLQIVLPIVRKLQGFTGRDLFPLPVVRAKMTEDLKGQETWADVYFLSLERVTSKPDLGVVYYGSSRESLHDVRGEGEDNFDCYATPLKSRTRIHTISQADAMCVLGEGATRVLKDEIVNVQVIK